MSNIAVYAPDWVSEAHHPQVDTGYGFTCDEEILQVVLILNGAGLKTFGSCQSIDEAGTSMPRREVPFTHPDAHRLLDLSLILKDKIGRGNFKGSMNLDDWYLNQDNTPTTPQYLLSWCKLYDDLVLRGLKAAIAEWTQ